MARCEVCGVEQYPANTVVRWDAAHQRHFFCSQQHMEQWNEAKPLPEEPEPREEQSLEEDQEQIEGQTTVEELLEAPQEPEKPAPKPIGRPKGSRNKPKVARKGA